MTKRRIVILGAGLTGLSVAWHLKKKKIDTIIFEKEPKVGGLCRSKKLGGFIFDYCGHLLHFRHAYTFKLVNRLLAGGLIEHKRSAWVYTCRKYIPYPFQANFCYLPKDIREKCLLDFFEASIKKGSIRKKNITFSDWIYRNFGEGIASYFMIPYNTKFWTVRPSELTSDWSADFIPIPNTKQVLKSWSDRNGAEYGYNHKFWYPRYGGINSLPLSLAQGLKNIHLGCKVVALDLDKKMVKFSSGAKEKFDILVSTIPLPEIPKLSYNLPGRVSSLIKLLRWNSILNLNLGLRIKDVDKRHWIYFPEKSPEFFRAGFFANFSPNMVPLNMSSLYAETSYSKERPLVKNLYFKKVVDDLKNLRICGGPADIAVKEINDIKYAYPIYDFNRKNALKEITDFLRANAVFSVGRYGGWKYLSMEDAILEGKDTSERIAFGCV